jgi:hypothetical protein
MFTVLAPIPRHAILRLPTSGDQRFGFQRFFLAGSFLASDTTRRSIFLMSSAGGSASGWLGLGGPAPP